MRGIGLASPARLPDPSELAVPVFHFWKLLRRSYPSDRIFDDLEHVLVVISRKSLVTRPKVDDSAGAAGPGAAGAKHFAAGEAADEEGGLGLRDVEILAVHFLAREDEVIVDARDDRVAGAGDP